jgi:hypothetical protein
MWMVAEMGPQRALGFGYEDPTAGPSMKGCEFTGVDPAPAVRAAIEAPTMTLRLAGVVTHGLAPQEIARLGLPATPPWLQWMPGARPLQWGTATAPPPRAPIATRSRGGHPFFYVLAMFGAVLLLMGLSSAFGGGGTNVENIGITLTLITLGGASVIWPIARWFARPLIALGVLVDVLALTWGVCAIPMGMTFVEARAENARAMAEIHIEGLCAGRTEPVQGTTIPGTLRTAHPLGTMTDYYDLAPFAGRSLAAVQAAGTPADAIPELVVCVSSADTIVETATYVTTSGSPVAVNRVQPGLSLRVIRIADRTLIDSETLSGGIPGPFPYETIYDVRGTEVPPAQLDAALARFGG